MLVFLILLRLYLKNIKTKNQQIVYDHLNKLYSTPNSINLIMGTGEGKSYIGDMIATSYAKRILIIVPNSAIMQSHYKIYNTAGYETGCWGAGMKLKRTVTIGIINSLIKCDKDWFDFDFIIFDILIFF